MTEAKKLKQAIRARSAKTGESYTAARLQVLKARRKRALPPTPATAPPPARPAAATRSGLSEKAVVEKTGHGFDHWFALLDAFGAAAKGHTATARHLALEQGVPGWHAQGITVAYERARGLREVNQAAGGFQVAVSKMVPVDLDTALAALRGAERKKWLAGADPALRRALEGALAPGAKGLVRGPKRSRVRYKWDATHVELVFEPRGTGTSVVAANTKLRNAAQVAERRTQWRNVLDALRTHLAR
jgi:hypothetical protein